MLYIYINVSLLTQFIGHCLQKNYLVDERNLLLVVKNSKIIGDSLKTVVFMAHKYFLIVFL
jgi:hypothetical protein